MSPPSVDPSAFVHPTALIEAGVSIGAGTKVWDNVHVRGPATSIGTECIVGEKTYIAYDVSIGDRVKVNAFVYICALVTIEDGVMISAGTTFTNDMFPRATTPDLVSLLPSAPDENTLATVVRSGATIGARTTIGCDLEIGRWAMTGMGSVVTRSVPPFHLVVGTPARSIACVCRCGLPFVRFGAASGHGPPDGEWRCGRCSRSYRTTTGLVTELDGVPGLDGDLGR